ncbi:DUF397 domain-containing protein [Streptomyces phaeochromogenes]|uniref:DUF397 domain-containing protein n=1 Tax=Streptomyces phaeochromogenes TaxID=1923 RepID=A0ABZ1HE34_STRPH|nr:DUF397 domain-containing protein [Streptomyces phaeochromogenes]WSD16861.1 DUF397 domain-containing protein [Streptomyces phaeochromogenes]
MNDELKWSKSSYSDSEGGACVEVALTPTTTHIRDTKLAADSPQLKVRAPAWSAFISATPTAPSPGS